MVTSSLLLSCIIAVVVDVVVVVNVVIVVCMLLHNCVLGVWHSVVDVFVATCC